MQFNFGAGSMWGTRTDVTNSTPHQFGTLQDVSLEFDGEVKELWGSFQFPVDVARGKVKITGKAKFAQVSGLVYNDLFFGQTLTKAQLLTIQGELNTTPAAPATYTVTTNADSPSGQAVLNFASTTTVVLGSVAAGVGVAAGATVLSKTSTTVTLSAPNTADCPTTTVITFTPPVTITVANGSTFSSDLGVLYSSSGNPLVLAATYPITAGQYMYNATTGIYTFNPADAATNLSFSYTYTYTTSGALITGTNQLMGTTPRFSLIFSNQYQGKQLNLSLLQCTASKMSMPTKIDDYVISELDFSAFANAAGNVYQMSTS